MFSQLKRMIASPTTNNETVTDNARVLGAILWCALPLVAASNIVIYFMLSDPYQSVVVQTSILLVIIIALRLMYRGHARLAAGAFVGSTWLIILGSAVKYDGVHGFAFTAYILVILMAGLLLGERAGIFLLYLVWQPAFC